MNFGGHENNLQENGFSSSVRTPGSGRRASQQQLMMRQQQFHSPLYQSQMQQPLGAARTPRSRSNTPSKGLPKSSYLQRRTPGQSATPLQNDHTPHATSYSRMSIAESSPPPSMSLSTPGRSGGRPGNRRLYCESGQQVAEYSRMDETLSGGEVLNSHENDVLRYENNVSTSSFGAGLRHRRGLNTPGGDDLDNQSMNPLSVSKHIHPHWIIVFGIPRHASDDSPCSTKNILKLFQSHGEIDNYHCGPGNWLLIKFSSAIDAKNASGSLHRSFLSSEVMIGVESLTPDLARKLNLSFEEDGTLMFSKGEDKKLSRVEQTGKIHGALLDPDCDNIMRPPRKVTKDICTRIFEFFMY